jgi:hypothetical protein
MDDRDQPTRLVLAKLQGVVMRHARWEPLGEEEMAAAVAEVDEVLAARDDGPQLLAYVAGILTGSRFGWPDELAQAVIAASVCVAAGADEFTVDGWCCIGAERRAEADRLPAAARLLLAGLLRFRPEPGFELLAHDPAQRRLEALGVPGFQAAADQLAQGHLGGLGFRGYVVGEVDARLLSHTPTVPHGDGIPQLIPL